MALAVANISSQATGTQSAVVTAPASISAGDLLVAHCSSGTSNGTFTPPSGWTSIANTSSSGYPTDQAFYKIATGSEPGTYTFTFSSSVSVSARIVHITGAQSSPIMAETAATSGSFTSDTISGVTTTYTNTMLIGISSSANGGTVSSMSVGGTNPTWSPQYMDGYGSSEYAALQTAIYASPGATGSFTVVQANSGNNAMMIVAIRPALSLTANNSAFATTTVGLTIGEPVTAITSAFSMPAVSVMMTAPKWSNVAKSAAATFTNVPKS